MKKKTHHVDSQWMALMRSRIIKFINKNDSNMFPFLHDLLYARG